MKSYTVVIHRVKIGIEMIRPKRVRLQVIALCLIVLIIGCSEKKEEVVEAVVKDLKPLTNNTNVVIIILDTLRADKLGCYGNRDDTSPEIDRIASKGVLFSNVLSQSSWTRPSIGSMITGVYPRTLGLYKEKNERLDDRVDTLADGFKDKGYTTIGVTANPNINSVFGFAKGFDNYIDSNRVWDWMKNKKGRANAAPGSLMSAKEVFRESIKSIGALSSPPYYLQLNVMEMHNFGARARQEFRELYRGHKNERYLQQLRQISVDVAQFIEDLVELPGMENTLFVLTSDHGEGLDDHPSIPMSCYHGYVLYESQLKVPLVFYHSQGKIGEGLVVDHRARNIDLLATIYDLMGWKVPKQEGLSLVPLFRNPRAKINIPKLQVVETQFRDLDSISVYSEDWKYFEHRRPWKGLAQKELQRAGHKEDGLRTSMLSANYDIASPLIQYLSNWEAKYKKMPPVPIENMSDETLQQLKAIGYID
jgi:arylsulfatase A-like enzyme